MFLTLEDSIYSRIEGKKYDYLDYNFTQTENSALKSFFDLSQVIDKIEDFYNLCVAVPKSFFNIETSLYIVDPKLNTMALVARTDGKDSELYSPPPEDVKPNDWPYYTDRKSLVLTIRGKEPLIDQLPFDMEDDVLGSLEIHAGRTFNAHQELFFQKYANRIGFNILNRFLMEKKIEHLR